MIKSFQLVSCFHGIILNFDNIECSGYRCRDVYFSELPPPSLEEREMIFDV